MGGKSLFPGIPSVVFPPPLSPARRDLLGARLEMACP